MGSSDPTLTEKTYFQAEVVQFSTVRMIWPAVATLSLALSVSGEEDQILQDDPCLARSKVVGDVQYCDRYWECEFGNPELYDCPNGLVWVGKNQGIADGCDYPWRHTNICKNKDLANPPQSTEHCDWLYGIFGHETSCTRYWTRWNGTATEQFCIGGLLYNEETHACDWPQNVAGCQKHPLCKDDANGNVPLGKSCNRYWACQGGYPRLQRCPAMLVFDKNRRRCATPPTEDCEVPTTKAPPPGEEGDNFPSGPRGDDQPQQSPNPRRGGGGRRPQGGAGPARPISSGGGDEPLPFKLPPGAVPFNPSSN